MWNDLYNDEYLTPEEQNALYLQHNPHIELGLWREWVEVVCNRERIGLPSDAEWDQLRGRWHHNKAPVASVAELKHMRGLL